MATLSLVFKELYHRKVNFALAALAVVTAVAFYTAFSTAGKASNRETARLMLSMGYNMHIISEDTDMDQFLLTSIPDKTMPAEYLDKLASAKKISYNHLLATLQKKTVWRGQPIVLTGLAPEVCPPGRHKPPMGYQIDRGTAYVGYRTAQSLGIEKGQKIEINGVALTVARCLSESGGIDDVRVHCHIADAQAILDMPGRISDIQAVDCLCFNTSNDPVKILRAEIGRLLPKAQVFQMKSIAGARTKQRQMVRKLFALIMPFVVIACGVWIGVLAIMNVKDRQQEIGIMRALGYGSARIAFLFLAKAVIVGAIGAVVGYAAGTVLAMYFGPDIFKITAKTMVKPETQLLIRSLAVAPLFAALASFIPSMIAVAYDPAVTLREE